MNKREFLKLSAALSATAMLPSSVWALAKKKGKLRTAHVGVGGMMGGNDLESISSHKLVEVVALCDVDSKFLEEAKKLHPNAKTYADYRVMMKEMEKDIDAVIVSTPDHSHAPVSLLAMGMDKPVYCQKPLTHHVSESRAMDKMAKEKGLVTQMGIQVHSFYDYKLATQLIQTGIIGKVKRVRAWSPKDWGFDGPEPKGSDPIPENLDWNLWQGTAPERDYKEERYHPIKWRQILDYGCGTLGDMGVHIFDTPYNSLALDVPTTIKNDCRKPTGYGFPANNTVTYEFPTTEFTTDDFQWIWHDGKGAPGEHEDLKLPDGEELHDQGAMFIGEKGNLYLPHYKILPRHIVDGKYVDVDLSIPEKKFGKLEKEPKSHYHQFVDTCLGEDKCSAPFSYGARLTETILLGVIAGRFPGKTLHWDAEKAEFKEKEANQYLVGDYRKF